MSRSTMELNAHRSTRSETYIDPAQDLASRRWVPWVWLVLAFVIGVFSSGHWVVPVLAWVAPVFAMRFFAAEPRWLGLVGLLGVGYTTFLITQHGIIPMPDEEFAVVGLMAAVIGLIPYWFHLRLSSRLQSVWGTLGFPAMIVAVDYLLAQGPFGTWGSLATTQYRNTAITQIAALAGTSGIVFVMSWFASILDWAWSRSFALETTRRPLLLMFTAMAMLMLYGQFRIRIGGQFNEQVRVAGIIRNDTPFEESAIRSVVQSIRAQEPLSVEDRDEYRVAFNDRRLELLKRSEQAAELGAKLIYWSEGALAMLPEDEHELIAAGLTLSGRHRVYLGMAIVTLRNTQDPAFVENKIVVAFPDGKTTKVYFKNLIPPGEPSIAGDGQVPCFETEFGPVANVICFDTDFPTLMRQPAKSSARIVLAPSNDWQAAAEPHLAVSSLRAVENGYSLVRITSNGISAVVDPVGRIVHESNSLNDASPVFIVNVPLGRISTVYSGIGDLLAISCCLAVVLVVVMVFVPVRRKSTADSIPQIANHQPS